MHGLSRSTEEFVEVVAGVLNLGEDDGLQLPPDPGK